MARCGKPMFTRVHSSCSFLAAAGLLSLLLASSVAGAYAEGLLSYSEGPDLVPVPFSQGSASSISSQTNSANDRPYLEFVPESVRLGRRWSAACAVGIIGDTTVEDYIDLTFDKLHGEGGGLTYNLTVTYVLHEFDWKLGRARLRPQLEVPFMLTLVDDEELDLMPDFNLGLSFRWRDCPWNRYLYTTFALGVGISYATQVWTGDYQRHRDDDSRSQWKFWLPIEVTVALPRYAQHQLMLFIDHQSGGQIFDAGGIDAWGFGYRYFF